MEEHRQQAASSTTVTLTSAADAALQGINGILRDIGFRVKTAALVEAALVELYEQMSEPGKAVEVVRRRVPPKSVVLPP